MEKNIFFETEFDKKNYHITPLPKGEYERCSFMFCNFNSSDLSHVIFIDCTFVECDMSIIKAEDTAFRSAVFTHCKLVGTSFEACNKFLFSVAFNYSNLNLASFFQQNLKKTEFVGCNLKGVDFTESNLSHAVFEDCNLENAIFENTNLEYADLRTARNYSISPSKNRIKKAKFSLPAAVNLLAEYDIEIS